MIKVFSLLRLASEPNSQKTHRDVAEIAAADTDVAEIAKGGMEVGV